MGGGGGGSGWSGIGDLRSLEAKAKAALEGARRNVFISFAMEDEREVNLLRAHAKNDNSDIEFNDHSVKEPYNSERAAYIKEKISERIARSSVCVVYLSDATAQSQWVAWEVSRAAELGKRIVGVHPLGAKPRALPPWVAQHQVQVVNWADLPNLLK